MYTARSTCPVCGDHMVVTRLDCRNCGSQLSGTFELPLLSRLSEEQLHFVEVMIKHRGSINRVSDELGIAYSAGRSRLDEIIRELGFESETADEVTTVSAEERQRILEDLSQGKITSEQAIKKLKAR
ncbi:MAG: DUF2089 domain-containing protein [Chloroflexi bacterium]|nr:DUF2089 domain-containing protein [Chloroflexota bacterium]